jgi:uncharacterized membrane-anchored protein YhcB (DUF1043 family)
MGTFAAISESLAGLSAADPIFWTVIVLLACLVYLRGTHQVMTRQMKMEAESSRRQEQTYQAMVQHYRQTAFEMQSRMEGGGGRATGGGSPELTHLFAENLQRTARLETRLDTLARELETLRRDVADQAATNATLIGSLSDLHHKVNGLNHAVQGMVEAG